MIAKLVKSDGEEQLHQCTHVVKRNRPGEGKTEVHVCPSGPVLTIPDDGEVIYILDGGKTSDTIRAPRAPKEKEAERQ